MSSANGRVGMKSLDKVSDSSSPATRRSVARAAGVSLTTVTHALNPTAGARVGQATRDRVRQIARQLGYRPNFVGRALSSGKTFTVGLLQPSHELFFPRLYQGIMLGMVRAMEADDYHLLMLFRSDSGRYFKPLAQGKVDGMFILQSDADRSHIEQVIASGVPTVVVNKDYPAPAGGSVGCVHSDHARLVCEVLDEFAGCGCRTVLFVHDYSCSDANAQIMQAFTAEMGARAASGMTGATFTPSRESFASQMRGMFASGQRWEGIFVDGILTAEILLAEARAAGLRAGKDFQLITSEIVDGATTAGRLERSAYTHQPELVGREAWRVLKGLIQNPTASDRFATVPYRRYAVNDG